MRKILVGFFLCLLMAGMVYAQEGADMKDHNPWHKKCKEYT